MSATTKLTPDETQGDRVMKSTWFSRLLWWGSTIYTYMMFETMLRTDWWTNVDRFRIKWNLFNRLYEAGFSMNPFAIILYLLVSFWAESGVVKYIIRFFRLAPIYYRVEVSKSLTLTKAEAESYVKARDWLFTNLPLFGFQSFLAFIDWFAAYSQMTSSVEFLTLKWLAITTVTFVVVFVGEVLFNVQQDPRDFDSSGLGIVEAVRGKDIRKHTTEQETVVETKTTTVTTRGKPEGWDGGG